VAEGDLGWSRTYTTEGRQGSLEELYHDVVRYVAFKDGKADAHWDPATRMQ